ncbi:damaged DNA binding protein [Rhizoctonia solani AG-1 IA]|uniref:Replication protein A subunit n=1 Tax=Thanatephorus cucumeris (strain AG1-IA) TaxID=983506 RepID=L8X9Q3_THACA|nr:damaged DNA binding protein [Rhizoctonia solani AG-1 IA]
MKDPREGSTAETEMAFNTSHVGRHDCHWLPYVPLTTCHSIPNSGSFVRPNTPGLTVGISFDSALTSKYIDTFQSDGVESVVLGSSNGAILVEGPRLNKVRAKFSQIERLRSISLNKYDVSNVGDPQAVTRLCQCKYASFFMRKPKHVRTAVQSLDLSRTLLGNWDAVADIIRCIPNLSTLELNNNRIRYTTALNTANFPKLTHLRLNSTMITWAQACEVLVYLPELEDLQLGYNQLENLEPSSRINTSEGLPCLNTLNLDFNRLSDWVSIMAACSMVPQSALKLGISLEPLASGELYALSKTSVKKKRLMGKYTGVPPGATRNFVVARLPALVKLNGTEVGVITERERTDAELFYLSWIGRNEQSSEADTEALHPRWKELATSIKVVKIQGNITKQQPVSISDTSTILRVLPTMSIKAFGMKLKKAMKLSSSVDPKALWILSSSESGATIPLRPFDTDPLHDLTWSGVEEVIATRLAVGSTPPQQMAPQLTSGALTRLMTTEFTPDAIGDFQPVLQLLSIKKVSSGGSSDRYRLVYSDGEYHCQSMLATKLNDYFTSQDFTPKCIIRLTRCAMNLKVDDYSEKIGNPVNFDKAENQAGAGPSAMDVDPAPAAPAPAPPKAVPSGPTSGPATNTLPAGFAPLHPIEALSPYSNKWTIRARVTQKSDIRTWSNQRGEGKLFSVNLMDETGEIRATGFNEVVDNLYSKLEEGKVYWFSKARVQLAKKQFSNLSNDYEIALERQTEAIPCEDESAVPKVQFNFTELSQLDGVEKDAMVDVLGVVTEVKPIETINVKSTGKTVSKRDVTVVDKSGSSVRMTIWGKQAETFQAENNPVIAFKGVKVGDFGGRTLSLVSSSTMTFHPDFPEAHALQGWYSSEGHSQTFKSQSTGGMGAGGGGVGTINRREMKTLQAVKEENLGMGEEGKTDFFTTRATIIHIKSDNIMYPACGSDNCSKKVTEVHDGWRCEKCEKTFPKPNYRYIMSLSVADYTQTAWLQVFNDPGELILGMTASELHELKEENEASYTTAIEKATSQTWMFQCRAQQSTYQDQSRVRYGVNRAHKIDYAQESRALLEAIKGYD